MKLAKIGDNSETRTTNPFMTKTSRGLENFGYLTFNFSSCEAIEFLKWKEKNVASLKQ